MLGIGAGAAVVAQDVPGSTSAPDRVSGQGAQIYREICQACHMVDARGGGSDGARIPALADNPRLADLAFTITTLRQGRGGMPGFGGMLTDAQMAAVLTYVRGHFNHLPDPVTEAEVQRAGGD